MCLKCQYNVTEVYLGCLNFMWQHMCEIFLKLSNQNENMKKTVKLRLELICDGFLFFGEGGFIKHFDKGNFPILTNSCNL